MGIGTAINCWPDVLHAVAAQRCRRRRHPQRAATQIRSITVQKDKATAERVSFLTVSQSIEETL
ncbi:MAG TPA: hypothetical protein VHC22_11830 [Pirellulales bacterium]|nr:hypothetical protein [Pirellulales bacterium]